MNDGIGNAIGVGDTVVRCGYNQYAMVYLYKVLAFTPKQIKIVGIEDGSRPICVSPKTLVVVTSLLRKPDASTSNSPSS